ncbi:MAG: aminoacyl-tRNA hydrolase [Tannerella sp.]|jgi:PTH1 family peptidyl-tRNA hydrolase|nr:aminoacyl-tRNA hydrolase [Tannerella sp.]
MKYLVTGLGNIGEEYHGTRHNIGFRVANELAGAAEAPFTEERYGAIARMRVKNAELIVLKPNTYMNLSGNAIRYWLQKEALPAEQLLVVVDDLSLPLGTLRIKPKGSSAGHNGLRNIEEVLGTSTYARIRFGIGSDFAAGKQYDFVLSRFNDEELEIIPARIKIAAEMARTFCLSGVEVTQNLFNNK